MSPTSHLAGLEVEDLFGHRRIRLDLDPTAPTVLTGGNGTGKSTLLRLVHAFYQGDLLALTRAPLTRLNLVFSDGRTAGIERRNAEEDFDLFVDELRAPLGLDAGIERLPSWLRNRLAANDWDIEATYTQLRHRRQSAAVSALDYDRGMRRLRDLAMHDNGFSMPDWYSEFVSNLRSVHISDQRLISGEKDPASERSSSSTQLAVERARAEIAEEIRKAESEYARGTQRMDRDLPNTLLLAMSKSRPTPPSRTVELMSRVNQRRAELRDVGLLEQTNLGLSAIPPAALEDDHQRRVIEVVMETDLLKLEIFGDLQERLSLLKSFLSGHLGDKKVALRREDGIHFRTSDDRAIFPNQLSSGEQQLFVLAYEIIFKAPLNSLVIVDEPELSLHVHWQDSLLTDLMQMGKPNNVQLLLATHSPTILARHPELERAIDETEGD